MKSQFDFEINRASQEDICYHLTDIDYQFTPSLSSRVNISSYSEKIYKFSKRFEVWHKKRLIALLAIYENSLDIKNYFITNLSVLNEFRGNGIGSALILLSIEDAKLEKPSYLSLEVFCHNLAAIHLYKKHGFIVKKKKGNLLFMELKV
jgi:ribosomal protein S18 acetylase RimI-like enzyme